MIVTCSQCLKRYMLDDVLIPREGRHVRCIACQHVWWQTPESLSLVNSLPFLELSPTELTHPKSISKKRSKWVGGVLCMAFLLSLISCFVFGRNMVVSLWPASERGYALLGLPVGVSGTGLAILNAHSLVHQDGPVEMVVVAGDVSNISERSRPIPSVKIKTVGRIPQDSQDTKRVLDYWEHHFSETTLLPGERIHFETAPRPKIEGTQHVVVDF